MNAASGAAAEAHRGVRTRTRTSADLRLIVRPARTDRLAEARGGAWGLLRRPLFFLFVCACTVSLYASGRVTVRLVLDGIVSMAFVPIFQVASLAVVAVRRPAAITFARALDAFFMSDGTVVLWLLAAWAIRACQTPLQASALTRPEVLAYVVSFVAVLAWGAYVDFWFFRIAMGRPPGRALRDLLVQRAIAWGASLIYFFGLAAWPMFLGQVR